MAIYLGIDTGGTYTDAVLIHNETTILAKAKALTTRNNLAKGVRNAVEKVMARANIKPRDIVMTSLSTTLATNALVEGKGGRVCLVFIGFTPQDMERQGLSKALKGDPVLYISGGHDHTGTPNRPFDEQALRHQLTTIKGISGFAIASQFATRNAEHEIKAREIIRQTVNLPVSCSHELSAKLGGPKRAMTAVLNARLIGMIDHLIGATENYFHNIGIDSQMMVVRGDGALISAKQAREKPIETILSGPAASIVGAKWLTNTKNALVSDIGGTTTDIALLCDGHPMIDPDGAQVGGLRTMVEAVAMRTFGLGGDSEIHINHETIDASLTLGPRRALPISLLAHDYPEIIHKILDEQLSTECNIEYAGEFLIAITSDPQGLSLRDQAVFDRIKNQPCALASAIKSRIDLGSINRLIERSIIMRSSVTPSDASHVLGHVNTWDRMAAHKALSIFARSRNGAGQTIATCAKTMAHMIINQLTEHTTEILLECAFAEDNIPGNPSELARHALTKAGLNHHHAKVILKTKLNTPIIGLGASAQTYYKAVGKRLDAKTILPDHGDVANAIGAVVGQITMRETGKITTPGEGTWRAFFAQGPIDYKTEESAFDAMKLYLSERVRKNAQQAGATNIRLRFEEDKKTATVENRSFFIEGTLIAIATGRPRITINNDSENNEHPFNTD